jgi:hypothetical protein
LVYFIASVHITLSLCKVKSFTIPGKLSLAFLCSRVPLELFLAFLLFLFAFFPILILIAEEKPLFRLSYCSRLESFVIFLPEGEASSLSSDPAWTPKYLIMSRPSILKIPLLCPPLSKN